MPDMSQTAAKPNAHQLAKMPFGVALGYIQHMSAGELRQHTEVLIRAGKERAAELLAFTGEACHAARVLIPDVPVEGEKIAG